MRLQTVVLLAVCLTVISAESNDEKKSKMSPDVQLDAVKSSAGHSSEEESQKAETEKTNNLSPEKIRRLRARLNNEPELPFNLGRMARFIFGTADASDDADRTSGLQMSSLFDAWSPSSLFGPRDSLFNTNLDASLIKRNLFSPEYVAVQVAQNAFNFVTSSLAWAAAAAIYTSTEGGRANDDDYTSATFTKAVSPSSTYSSSSEPFSFIQESPFFQAFSKSSKATDEEAAYKMPKSYYVNDQTPSLPAILYKTQYSSRRSKIDPPSDDEIKELTVEEIQKLLETEVKAQTGLFDSLTEKQKIMMYKKVKDAKQQQQDEKQNRREPGPQQLHSSVIVTTGAKRADFGGNRVMVKKQSAESGGKSSGVKRRRKLVRKGSAEKVKRILSGGGPKKHLH